LQKYRLFQDNYEDWDLKFSWISMDYWFNRQTSLISYNPYEISYEEKPILFGSIGEK